MQSAKRSRIWIGLVGAVAVVLLSHSVLYARTVEFTLLTHTDAAGKLPQPKGIVGTSGDHLLFTADDISGSTFNPQGCLSFNFMNPVGVWPPDYPAGYAEGIHSMQGSLTLDIDGATVSVEQLELSGYVAPNKTTLQRLVRPGDAAADGRHGSTDGLGNQGAWLASEDWSVSLQVDWYYDTPFAGHPGIDMTFDDYALSGYMIPVDQLSDAGLAEVNLDDPLGYFGGGSEAFETWLLQEIAPRLPADAKALLILQGEDHPVWTNPSMGMTTDGIVATTIIAYSTQVVPEPATATLLAASLLGVTAGLSRRKRT